VVGRRRLFIEPLKRAPRLSTYNGIGAAVHDEAEREPDGTYIKTHWFVVLFVPVFPLRSYLVLDGDKPGRSWRFVGQVPLSGVTFLWQRTLACAVACSVALSAVHAWDVSRHGTIYVVNGLPHEIHAAVVGAAGFDVAPNSLKSARLESGPQTLELSMNGHVIETGKLLVARGRDLVVWNVLNAALIYQEAVTYTAVDNRPEHPARPEFYCSSPAIELGAVDYAFTDPPRSVSMPKGSSRIVRRHLGIVRDPDASCVTYLQTRGKVQDAAALALGITRALGYELRSAQRATELLMMAGNEPAAVSCARSARDANPESIPHHRIYQVLRQQLDQLPELIAEYRDRVKAEPQSVDGQYLLATLLDDDEAAALIRAGLARAPRHPYLLRAQAAQDAKRGAFESAQAHMALLREVDEVLWVDAAEQAFYPWTAGGAIPAARQLIKALAGHAGTNRDARLGYVTQAVQLARFDPMEDPAPLLDSLVTERGNPAVSDQMQARLDGGLALSASELELVRDPAARSALEIALLARTHPLLALETLQTGDRGVIERLSSVEFMLLFGEAARLDPPHPALARLLDAMSADKRTAQALVRYIREGREFPELRRMRGELRAALDLARARRPELRDEQRAELLARVAAQDVLRGPVTAARDAWEL
jgi:hypothetical protein